MPHPTPLYYTKLWTIFSIFLRDAAYPFRTHSTPLECGRVGIPFSIDIALRWSAVFFSEFRECLQPSEKHTRL